MAVGHGKEIKMLTLNAISLVVGAIIGCGLRTLWEHRAEVVAWIKWMEEN